MSIEVLEIEEQEDGSAKLLLNIDEDTLAVLVEKAFVEALRDYIKEEPDE